MTDENHNSGVAVELLDQAVDVVAAYVSNNSVPVTELPSLIASIHSTLAKLSGRDVAAVVESRREPAVPVKKSVTADYIICLEDGKKFKSLKRHLNSAYGLTPVAYREKWGLPPDYPMVAPGYSATRSQLAKNSGLGSKRAALKAVASPKVSDAPKKQAGRGRPKKAA